MLAAIEAAVRCLPADRPRYLMGVGDPAAIVAGIRLGVDMFDCVLPTRLGRHGTALTGAGRLPVKAARFARDASPLDPSCTCAVCGRHSRAYLRHLFNVGEPSAGRLVSLHNLAWLAQLVGRARQAVSDGGFSELYAEVMSTWGPDLRSNGEADRLR
jgi:queuine tRNA-ribosyltransferase